MVLRRFGEAVGAAADVEASGEDAFGGDAAFGALLHGVPEGEDAGLIFVFGSGCGRRCCVRRLRRWDA